ncbi:MAG TPA: translocation/assembly module TamB domain-containing protein [Mucilaginibacter sp.]|nr:translocation/assembly module TamB domain-containing protein [Mucilaginibacter sp.]
MVILLIFSILLLVFQYKPVQTWAAKKGAAYLSEKLGTKVSIKSIYIKPFSSVVLEGFYVLDKQKDTLLSTPKLEVDLSGFSLFNSIQKKVIDFKLIELDNGSAYLKKQSDSTSNLKFIIDAFSGPPDTTKSKPWQVVFEKIAINNFHFRFKNMLVDTVIKGINFDDLDVSKFSVVVRNMDIANHLFKGNVTNLTLREKSGFYLKKFNADATIDTNQILAQNLYVLTNRSLLKNYFRMKFKSIDDLGDHIEDAVYMDGDFKSSRISSSDIAYFTTGLEDVHFNLGLDGRIKGYVNNLTAKNLTVTGAKATYIRGNFNLKGLPDWDNTFLELDFDQIATNKADLDYLFSNFTGKPTARVPDIISRFGNINFSGRFTGLQNDFVAYGTFKTKLGRFDPDINLKINKAGVPSYSGKLDTYAFDLGSLLGEEDLGRITMNANVNGQGDELKTLRENVDARISSVSFKGYNYHNVAFTGGFAKKVATGKLTINDKKIRLDGSGSIDLNPKLPVYSFNGSIDNAQLHDLKLLKDTITFTTRITADFSGNELNNLTGEASLQQIRIVDPRNDYVVDSLTVSATGLGNQRAINLKSDIADGFIKGSFDLPTLPSYFKTVVKKYIPSLKTEITPPKPQDFSFNLTLKKIDPLIAIFMPDLKIPEQGTFIGEFNSEKKTATLSSYIKTIKYGKMVFHDFIIDEGTNDDFLGLNISLSKINITDSLFIKNITATNFLKNDSLNFNLKLSDKDAVNQLDLYGLVNFGRDTTAKLHILPSDVILEHQNWKILEKVRVKFLDGKTQVQGFELSNGTQKVKIDGFISDNPADNLKVAFQNFSMSTLNQLTRPSGVELKGLLNGDINLTSILKSPGIDAKLGIDSLMMNKTLVGDVKILSTLGNDRKKADVNINIKNRGLETMNLAGTYQIGHGTEDALNFDVNMNQTEAIIFEPFIKDLVSDIKGTISTNLKLTGPVSKPRLNGNIILNNTGVTVNYLKTPYTVSDTVDVVNSIVKIKDMLLRDTKDGIGHVDGTIDLNNLADPDIEVEVNARNLMALHTTFKDNHLYYGTAFGTGRFSFKGPIDNMKIDIKASTEAGTVFNIPLNTSMTVSDYDFIKFVGHRDTTKVEVKPLAFNGVTLNFDLTVDEKTTVKITTDYGVLEGSGQARDLKLNINSLGDFEMYGDFLITTGKFEFTAKNFISKNFIVNQGGTIRWTGNPSNASINLNAIYEVRTDIQPLYQAAGSQSPKGHSLELVQAELILTKTLLQPTIDFDFNFPLDPSIKEDLSTYLSDNNNRSQQALSIIVRRNFSNGANGNLTNQVFNTAEEAISEFAFNKLNSFISQSNIKNLDLNIRSFNDLGVSYRFKNRLILTGSLFNSSSGSNDIFNNNTSIFNSSFSQLTKDFEAQYLIRKDGNLSARYSYRVLNSTTLNTLGGNLTEQYVNGLGLVYQRDFDTFGEFIRNIFRAGRRKQAPVTPNPVPSKSGVAPTPTVDPVKTDEDDQ